MRKVFFCAAMLYLAYAADAQEHAIQDLKEASSKTFIKDPNDTIPKPWKTGGLFNLTFGQTALSNWAAGGDNFQMNINGIFNVHAYYAEKRHAWDNNLDLALGYTKTTSLGTRKSNDNIDLTSKYGYKLTDKSKWYASLLFNFRSQFAPGYLYTDTSTYKISDFFSPAYALLSLGFDFKPNKAFSLFISPVTSRWVIVTATGLNPLTPTQKGNVYGVPLGKTVENQIGAYLSANYLQEFIKNVTYKGKLDLFSNYKRDPQNIKLYMTNLLSTNVFKGLSFNLGLDLIYDDEVRVFGKDKNAPRTQIREYIGLGYMAKF